MKADSLTILTTPAFKAFLIAEAQRDGISVSELVRIRCGRETEENVFVAEMAAELREAVHAANLSLTSGLEEARSVLADLRERRVVNGAFETTANDFQTGGGDPA